MAQQNVKMSIKGSKLLLEIDLNQTLGTSKSGKSQNIATTGGCIPVPGKPDVKVGLNVFTPVQTG